MSGIELGYSYELGSGRTRIGVMTRPRWRLGMVMTVVDRLCNLSKSGNDMWRLCGQRDSGIIMADCCIATVHYNKSCMTTLLELQYHHA